MKSPSAFVAPLLGCAAALLVVPAAAADGTATCIEAHEAAQVEEQKGELRRARQDFLACALPTCPEIIRKECSSAAARIDGLVPTVLVEAKDGRGADVVDVRVTVDGEPLGEGALARAVPLDPGVHVFRFASPAVGTAEQRVVLREGEKARRVTAILSSEAPAVERGAARAADRDAPGSSRAVPTASWVLGGVGVVALGGFTFFALSGRSKESELAGSCAPFCRADDTAPVERNYLLADVSLGVALVSLGAAAVIALWPTSQGGR